MLALPPSRLLRFDAFTLDLTRCLLLRGDEELPLRRQSFDVLRTLAECQGRLASKEDLLQAVWPGVKVTDDSIVQCIKEIRQALGPEARWVIRTVPGRGYEFMAPVTAVEADAAPAETPPPSLDPQAGANITARPVNAVHWMRPPKLLWRYPLISAGLLIAVLGAGSWLIWKQLHSGPRLEPAAREARPYDPRDRKRLITPGGKMTCGFRGCQRVPEGCYALRNSGGRGLGGKIICNGPPAAVEAAKDAQRTAERRPRTEPTAVLTMMAAPTLAVLPFAAPDVDPAAGSEARAFSDDVAKEVTRHNIGVFLSLKSAIGYRGETTDAKPIGRRLDARYLLFGSLRREGERHSGNIRLVEAETGRELWARPFQYVSADRSLQAARIAGEVNGRLKNIENQRPLPTKLEAGHYAMLAFAALGSYRKAGRFEEALALSEKALKLDPNWVPALQTYVWAQTHLSRRDPPELRSARLDKAQSAAERAIKLAPLHPTVYHRYGQVLWARRDPAGALAANQIALRLNPNLAIAHAEVGLHKIDVGLAHEAIPHIREAIRLSPTHRWLSVWCLWAGEAAVHTGNYDEAVRWLQKGMHAQFPYWALKPWLAVAYAGLGREEEGHALIAQHLKEGRSLSISGWRKRHPRGSGVVAEQRARIEGLLKKLGVSDGRVQTGAVH